MTAVWFDHLQAAEGGGHLGDVLVVGLQRACNGQTEVKRRLNGGQSSGGRIAIRAARLQRASSGQKRCPPQEKGGQTPPPLCLKNKRGRSRSGWPVPHFDQERSAPPPHTHIKSATRVRRTRARSPAPLRRSTRRLPSQGLGFRARGLGFGARAGPTPPQHAQRRTYRMGV